MERLKNLNPQLASNLTDYLLKPILNLPHWLSPLRTPDMVVLD